MNLIHAIGLFGLTTASLAGVPSDADECCASTRAKATLVSETTTPDLVEVAAAAGSFETLLAAAKAAGLVDALRGDTPLTVFAPTDAAFAKLDQNLLADLLKPENKGLLQTILEHHIVPGAVGSAQVVELTETRALGGQRLAISVDEAGVAVNGATVQQVDVGAANGVIHVIDTVLIPNTEDVIGTALADGNFGTLAKALTAGGLVEALRAEGPFTVFAPTDAAFAKLDQKVLASLLKPENRDQLVDILTYHVVPGRLSARTALAAGVAETLQGQPVRLSIRDGQLRVGNAKVVSTDLDATNGVIHVIDTVLLPQ